MLAPFSVNGRPPGACVSCSTGVPASARPLPWTMQILPGRLPAFGQPAGGTLDLLSFVQSQVKISDDRATADYLLHKVKLTQRLDVRSVEDLQGKGAGPQTLRALRKLAEDSAGLPEPPSVVVVAPPPPAKPPNA